MATQASCDHPPLHDDIIFKQCINEDSRKGVYNRNILFVVIEKTLLIVDCANFIEYCPHCNLRYKIYIYGSWPDVRASFDGVTDLPICVTVNDIEDFPYISICNAPRFGNNFIYSNNFSFRTPMHFIMYGIEVTVKTPESILQRHIFVDGKPAICCITTCGKFILLDCCGNIIKAEVVYSKTGQLFKIGNGCLSGKFNNNTYEIDWTYTSAPVLNTKPAAASTRAADE